MFGKAALITRSGSVESLNSMALAPGTRLGCDGVLVPIGAGGLGEVYKARDKRLDRAVGSTVSPKQLPKRFDTLVMLCPLGI